MFHFQVVGAHRYYDLLSVSQGCALTLGCVLTRAWIQVASLDLTACKLRRQRLQFQFVAELAIYFASPCVSTITICGVPFDEERRLVTYWVLVGIN